MSKNYNNPMGGQGHTSSDSEEQREQFPAFMGSGDEIEGYQDYKG